jgi:hypothetical protein
MVSRERKRPEASSGRLRSRLTKKLDLLNSMKQSVNCCESLARFDVMVQRKLG